MKTSQNISFAHTRQPKRIQKTKDTRNISPSPDRPDKARLLDTAFLADRGVMQQPLCRDTHALARQ